MTADRHDVWQSGDPYERYVGRWSRLVAREFVAWLATPAGRRWLDVGSGTGALTQAVLDGAAPDRVTGVEPSAGFLDIARARLDDRRVVFEQGDALALPLPDDAVDAAVSGLVLNFVPDPARAVAEMCRVTRPGGVVALYVWDYAGEMQLMRHFWEAAAALDPAAAALDEGLRFPVCAPGALGALLEGAGLDEVATRAIDVPTVFRDFDDYWAPFLGGQGPAPGYCASLDPEGREQLRLALAAGLPRAADGSIPLLARAFAVRGRVPAP